MEDLEDLFTARTKLILEADSLKVQLESLPMESSAERIEFLAEIALRRTEIIAIQRKIIRATPK